MPQTRSSDSIPPALASRRAADNRRVAGVYDRVSQETRKTRGRSTGQQNELNLIACEENRWPVARHISDPDISASDFGRKQRKNWDAFIGDVKAGVFNVAVLWEVSRGDRRSREWQDFLHLCEKLNVLIYITKDERAYDVHKAADWKSLADAGTNAEYDSRMTSDRVKRDMKSAARLGLPHGKIPYGYMRVYDEHTKELLEQKEHPEQGPIVREIFDRIASSEPLRAILRDLNERKAPSPGSKPNDPWKPWGRRTVYLLAQNPTYIGKRMHLGVMLEKLGTWAAIVDEDVFWAAQRVLTDPERFKTRPGKQRWLLSYLLRCELCGEWMQQITKRRQHRDGTETVYRYYRCDANRCGSAIGQEWLDKFITGVICTRLAETDAVRDAARDDDGEVAAARADAAKWRADLADWKKKALKGEIDSDFYAEVEADRKSRIAAAEARMKEAHLPKVARDLARAGDLKMIVASWQQLDIGQQREVIKALCRITVSPKTGDSARYKGQWNDANAERVHVEWLT